MGFTFMRRAIVALASAGAATAAVAAPAHAYFPDPVRLTDSEIDFGDGSWVVERADRARLRPVERRRWLLHAAPRRDAAPRQRR